MIGFSENPFKFLPKTIHGYLYANQLVNAPSVWGLKIWLLVSKLSSDCRISVMLGVEEYMLAILLGGQNLYPIFTPFIDHLKYVLLNQVEASHLFGLSLKLSSQIHLIKQNAL